MPFCCGSEFRWSKTHKVIFSVEALDSLHGPAPRPTRQIFGCSPMLLRHTLTRIIHFRIDNNVIFTTSIWIHASMSTVGNLSFSPFVIPALLSTVSLIWSSFLLRYGPFAAYLMHKVTFSCSIVSSGPSLVPPSQIFDEWSRGWWFLSSERSGRAPFGLYIFIRAWIGSQFFLLHRVLWQWMVLDRYAVGICASYLVMADVSGLFRVVW